MTRPHRRRIGRGSLRDIIGCVLLGTGFAVLSLYGVAGLLGAHVSTVAAEALAEGRRAFFEQRWEAAFANFNAVLESIPESGQAAQGAACSLWHLGEGARAMTYQQIAINNGLDFDYQINNCFSSPTPPQLFHPLTLGLTTLLYRVPVDSQAEDALARAKQAIVDDKQAEAAAALACVNRRADIVELATIQRRIARAMSASESQWQEIDARLQECVQ